MCSDKWEQEQMQDQAEVSARLLSASVRLEIMQLHNLFQSVCQTFILVLFFFSYFSTITLVGAKKRKRNASSDHSDGEISPASPVPLDDELIMVQTSDKLDQRSFKLLQS